MGAGNESIKEKKKKIKHSLKKNSTQLISFFKGIMSTAHSLSLFNQCKWAEKKLSLSLFVCFQLKQTTRPVPHIEQNPAELKVIKIINV